MRAYRNRFIFFFINAICHTRIPFTKVHTNTSYMHPFISLYLSDIFGDIYLTNLVLAPIHTADECRET